MYAITLTKVKTKESRTVEYNPHQAAGLLAHILQDADHVHLALVNSNNPEGYSADIISPDLLGFKIKVVNKDD